MSHKEEKSDAHLLELARSFLAHGSANEDYHGHDASITKALKPLTATLDPRPTMTFAFHVCREFGNQMGNFHGGAIATLLDNATSLPLILPQREGYFQMGGVSRRLDCTYLRPCPVGTDVVVKAEVLGVGKRMALVRGTLLRASDGAIIATCDHDKANTDPLFSKL